MDPTSDKPASLFDFADALALFSTELLRYRLRNKAALSSEDQQALQDQETQVDVATAQVRAQGIAALGFLVQDQVAEVATATDDAQAFLRRIKRAEKALAAVAAVLALGQAVVTRSPKGVADAVKTLKASVA